ncbi:YpeB-like protein with putative protease inhibitory function [Stella humosa]|uniref:YpeB-like protein with putative protease inhibitory function n=1 Tax=Stella humosa TaxID=94 RepID=A0A3N1L0S2_9PROT|nr:PepSY domain-containing protein [Stella humosa]ROP84046.1 YpeB-like protein with putative protease inhibitory function [Stella humosa]
MIARRHLLSLLAPALAATLAAAPALLADDAPRRGLLPVSAILARVEARFDGTVLDADVRAGRDGRVVYEVRFLARRGNLLQIRLDAATGAFLDIDGHGFIEAIKPGAR